MTEFANHEHLSHHHRDTLATLFVHPTSGNLKWVDVLSLLAAVGSCEDKSGGDVRVVLGSETEVFNVHHNKDLTIEQISDLRRMFRHAGFVVAPAADGQPEA
ncbi:MAG: hypothetical protein ACOYO9_12540 [Candidatus Nanopelagicales bacterium]|jgi:hypothetical protein